jgi:hypothetical protein
MASIEQQIRNAFVERLQESDALDDSMLDQLREVLASSEKKRPAKLIAIFTSKTDKLDQ